METLKKRLRSFLEKDNSFLYNEELEVYEDFLENGCDFFQKSSKVLMSLSFFALVYNAKSEKSFEENNQVIRQFEKTNFFHSSKDEMLLVKILEQLFLLEDYEVNMLVEYTELAHASLFQQMKNKEKLEKIERLLGDKVKCLDFLKRKVSYDDLFFVLNFYNESNKVIKKTFSYLVYYIKLFFLYKHNAFSSRKELHAEYRDFCKQSYNLILDYTKKLQREQKNSLKAWNTLKNLCQKRLDILEDINPSLYLEITEEEIQHFPISILETMETVFLEHNEKIVEHLDQNLSLYYQEQKILFQQLCHKYQMFISNEDFKYLLNQTFDVVSFEERLKIFKKLNLSLSKPFLFLFCSSLETFQFFTNLYDLKVLSHSFLTIYLESLLDEEKILKIKENYSLLGTMGLHGENLDMLLLLETKDILLQKEVADTYQLTSYDGIFEPHFFLCLDIWIEHGLFPYFSKNQMLSHLDFVSITKRILIGLQLGLPIFDEEGKVTSQFLDEKKFLIPNNFLDSYITNHVSLYLEEHHDEVSFDDLDSYFMKDFFCYDFDGVLISRPKVLRNKSLGFSIEESIFYGSILNYSSCEKVCDILKEKQKEISRLTNS